MSSKVLIIAEAGVNHNGDLDKALALIDAAAEAGADYVKFQTFKTEKLVHKDAKKAAYQIENTKEQSAQFEMLKRLEIPEEWYPQLMSRAKTKNIRFLSTGFDEESIDFLNELGCDFFKVPSGELTNKPYLEYIAKKGKPIILSTGMATLEDIQNALSTLKNCDIPDKDISVLHCTTQYPTPMEEVNLRAMNAIREAFNLSVGYSDHTLGIEIPIAAVALGATVIEKHFTLDRSLSGPDHAASLVPEELKAMVSGIRNVEKAISGSGIKEPTASELENRIAARKSIHLSKELNAGDSVRKQDLVMLRPGDGISPMEVDSVIGRKLKSTLSEGSKLTWEDLA